MKALYHAMGSGLRLPILSGNVTNRDKRSDWSILYNEDEKRADGQLFLADVNYVCEHGP
jgi:hypothetical protein